MTWSSTSLSEWGPPPEPAMVPRLAWFRNHGESGIAARMSNLLLLPRIVETSEPHAARIEGVRIRVAAFPGGDSPNRCGASCLELVRGSEVFSVLVDRRG
jgi:hypothetical protein